ncbi:hypothetical protein BJ741DRAFT_137143 [Chytriomyces cf. hyalinus JEL632]|nr:hypothetical protein BJ741DRAFT_137143 [Chytriomyces cf. hyalinus JEL632]
MSTTKWISFGKKKLTLVTRFEKDLRLKLNSLQRELANRTIQNGSCRGRNTVLESKAGYFKCQQQAPCHWHPKDAKMVEDKEKPGGPHHAADPHVSTKDHQELFFALERKISEMKQLSDESWLFFFAQFEEHPIATEYLFCSEISKLEDELSLQAVKFEHEIMTLKTSAKTTHAKSTWSNPTKNRNKRISFRCCNAKISTWSQNAKNCKRI